MSLIIAEKPSAGRRISQILSSSSPKTLEKNVYEADDHVIVPLRGHIIEVDFPSRFSNWQSANLNAMAESDLVYKPSVKSIQRKLKKFGKKADKCIVATDFDREGESIGKEAVNIIKEVNPDIDVKRARFSSLAPSDVEKAFNNLTELDKNLANSADSRREIDLIWGAVLTRFVSLVSNRLGKQFLSVGRVQTPTLAMIVERQKERDKFDPKDYWTLKAELRKDKKFKAEHKKKKFWKKEEVDKITKKLRKADKAQVKKLKKRKKSLKPPTPFNTTAFLRAASRIGLSPSQAINTAESLYQNGFISYPRTDNTQYPKSLGLKKILKKFTEHAQFKNQAKELLSQKKIKPTKGKKKSTDHPPIHPVELANKKSLSNRQWKVYKLIVSRFFATVAPKAVLNTVRADFNIEGENFFSRGRTFLKKGWKKYYPYSKTRIIELPELKKNDEVNIEKIIRKKKQTKPPKKYSPSALIKKMEDKNLGTKSTRPSIINKLQGRRYIKGYKKYTPTNIAKAVVNTLDNHVEEITQPKMTSKLKKEMEQISEGKKSMEEVVGDSRNMLSEVLDEMVKEKGRIGEELKKAIQESNVIAECECGGNLRVIRSKKSGKRFVGCSNYPKCKKSYPLPQKGGMKALDEKCEECGAPKVKILRGKKTFEMCLNPDCKTKEDWK